MTCNFTYLNIKIVSINDAFNKREMVKLNYYFQNPKKGFDPVPLTYAKQYAAFEYKKFNSDCINEIISNDIELENKTLLDLGGGPGQYSLEFAKRGAKVTWHDISKNYLDIAKSKAEKQNLNINFSLGYLDDVRGKYDIIFNRICWYYCLNDSKFANLLYALVKDDGYAYIIVNNEMFLKERLKKEAFLKRMIFNFSFWVNETFDIKLIHIHPSHKKLNKVFANLKFKYLNIERNGLNTLIKFKK